MNRLSLIQNGWKVLGAAFVVFLPLIVPEMKIHLATEVLVYCLFAVSFNLLLGYAGLLPFGFAAMFGVGAYGAALMFNNLGGTPLAVVMLVAAASGLISAVMIGAFCVRLGGTYFALLTLAFQMFFYAIALKWRSVTNGDDGIPVMRPEIYFPGLGNLSLMDIHNLYWVTLFFVVLGILAAYLFLKTPLGNAVVCMRENEERAAFLGYNIYLTKLTIFSFSGMLAGLAGALYALFQEFVATTVIDANMSFAVVLMTIVGGTGRFAGPIVGAVFFMLFQDWISDLTDHWWLYFGIVFIAVVMYLEGGLISLFSPAAVKALFGRKTGVS
jgi:branched-chain amino acid transport system permease protein